MQISLSDGDTISQVQFSSKTASKICDKLKKKSSTCKVLVAIQFIQAVGSPFSLKNTASKCVMILTIPKSQRHFSSNANFTKCWKQSFPPKKTASKCVNIAVLFYVPDGRRFRWQCNFYKVLKVLFPTNQTALKSVIIKTFSKSRRRFYQQCKSH